IMASPRSIGMGGPFDLRAAWGMFCNDVALWQLFGHGALTVELGETGECVGQVGINHGPLFPEKELGWFVYEEYEGRGYATEAAL
ncbi:GNAT family N-acetyltransferase, partial [Rhizobium leguminosarum]|uniref:GNAT family N-acetyltransferase n=1 Tax=Rhizobium leguminosarum TaxID=384 RepID=UPI003F9BFC19